MNIATAPKRKIKMRVIGLTGSIASGKSTISKFLAEKFSVPILDADKIAHELTEPKNILWQSYVDHFGEEILNSDFSLNRQKIADLVFQNPQEYAWMNGAAHPIIRQELQQRIEMYRQKNFPVVVLDVPLLFEANMEDLATEIWVSYIAEDVQLKRLLLRDGGTIEQAKARIAKQLSSEEKKSRADVVIDTNGTREEIFQQVVKYFHQN